MQRTLVLMAVPVFVGLAALVVVSGVGCEEWIEEHNRNAEQYRKDYQRDFKKRFDDAMKNVNPDLPVKERCAVVTDLVVPKWGNCTEESGWECYKKRFEVQTMCEAMSR